MTYIGSMINSTGLSKNFLSYKKEPGLLGSIKALYKRDYQTKEAVKDFNLDIGKGEIIGLLGPNGAGKTTLMKMFTGIIVPSSGDLTILGYKPWERDKEFRKKIALVMGQKSQLWWDIPAMDSFQLLQKYYELDNTWFKNRVNEMAELLNVTKLLHVHVRKLSLGERMKMELMASLLHSPEVIFLDEPTIGLDLLAQEKIREFIKDYHAKYHATIIITSHYMADVQALCKKLVLIFDGEKHFDGDIKKFENILGHEKTVSFTFDSCPDKRSPLLTQFDAKWGDEGNSIEFRVPEKDLREFSKKILTDFPVTEFNTDKLPIERVMKTLMKNHAILKKI